MTNKYTGFHSAERVDIMLEKESIKEMIEGLVRHFRFNPVTCLIPTKERIQIRHNGTKFGVKTRSLVFYAAGNALPSGGFLRPTCGCPGCVNPDHQHSRIKLSEFPLFKDKTHTIINHALPRKPKVYNPFEDDAATKSLVDHMKNRTAQASHETS